MSGAAATKKRRTIGPLSPSKKETLEVSFTVKDHNCIGFEFLEDMFLKIPAELIMKFDSLCCDCGQSVNTKECAWGNCTYEYVYDPETENESELNWDLPKKFAQNVELRSNRLLFYSIRASFHKYCQLQFIIIHYVT